MRMIPEVEVEQEVLKQLEKKHYGSYVYSCGCALIADGTVVTPHSAIVGGLAQPFCGAPPELHDGKSLFNGCDECMKAFYVLLERVPYCPKHDSP